MPSITPVQSDTFDTELDNELQSHQSSAVVSGERFDRFTRYAASMFSVPVSMITVVDGNHQSVISCSGLAVYETVCLTGLCASAILEDSMLVVPDASVDSRFAHDPLVRDESGIRFYAGAVMYGENGQPIGTLGIMDQQQRQFTEQQQQQLVELARLVEYEINSVTESQSSLNPVSPRNSQGINVDDPSGLLDAGSFRDVLHESLEIRKITEPEGTVMVACMLIDNIEDIRECSGAGETDSVIRTLVARIRDEFPSAVTGKYEEDYLSLCIPLNGSELSVDETAARISELTSKPVELDSASVYANVRLGISHAPEHGEDVSDLMTFARCALADIESQPDASYQLHGSNQGNHPANGVSMEGRLRSAISNDALFLLYQPTVDLTSGKILGAEVLCRWTDDHYGDVSPSQFFALAERAGMCDSLDDWVIRAVCKQIRAWKDEDVMTHPVAINLTGTRLREASFCKYLKELLVEYGLRGNDLIFEINEGSLSVNTETTIMNMEEIRCLGVRFSIDDFGTGYSSLRYLHLLPVHSLKIDRTFTQHVTTSKDDAIITKTIISMAKGLGMQVIAEGVETIEQVKFLQKNGCVTGQGYLFSKPVALSEYEQLLDNGSTYRSTILSCHEDDTAKYFTI